MKLLKRQYKKPYMQHFLVETDDSDCFSSGRFMDISFGGVSIEAPQVNDGFKNGYIFSMKTMIL